MKTNNNYWQRLAVAGAMIVTLRVSAEESYDRGDSYDQGEYRVPTLDERVNQLERRTGGGSGLTELANTVERLRSEIAKLRGDNEDLRHKLDALKKQTNGRLTDLDKRVVALTPPPPPVAAVPAPNAPPVPGIAPTDPAAAAAAAAAAGVPGATVPSGVPATPPVAPPTAAVAAAPTTPVAAPVAPPPPPPPPVNDLPMRQAAYTKAFNLLKDGKYSEAVKDFKGFVALYPNGEYSDNAYYWMGEAQYVNHDFAAAKDSFKRVIKEFPQSGKVADAHVKLAFIEYDSGQFAAAKNMLTSVVKDYPNSSAAKIAEKRLEKMNQEKR